MAISDTDDHFRHFAHSLQSANLRKYGKIPEKDLLALQKEQVEKLVDLEDQFRRAVIESPYGVAAYSKFVAFICDDRKNILDARPYFRERQEVFTSEISGALKKRNEKAMFKFHGNWQLVSFMLKAHRWAKKSKVVKLAQEIAEVRNTIVEMNLPLAISRARIFYSRTPKSHLTHMDLVQIASEGLLSGVDKFCLPFSKMFRGVCIGRMVGNFIERYSETLVHFFPGDKRTLYRANKAASKVADRWSDMDFEALAEKINADNEDDPKAKTDASEIARLMAASSCVSADEADAPGTTSGGNVRPRETGLARYAAPESWRPDVRYEEAQTNTALARAISLLPVLEQKVLKLRGVDFVL